MRFRTNSPRSRGARDKQKCPSPASGISSTSESFPGDEGSRYDLAFLLRSAQRCFIISEIRLRAAALM
jgi:hypothetical protein